jgi:predicted DNA-binding transcriptional regulator AlpA
MSQSMISTNIRRDLTIRRFCQKHRIGKSTYYDLKKRGLGPQELHIGKSVRITAEADDEWVQRMQAQAAGNVPTFSPKHQARDDSKDAADDDPEEKRRRRRHRTSRRRRSHKKDR